MKTFFSTAFSTPLNGRKLIVMKGLALAVCAALGAIAGAQDRSLVAADPGYRILQMQVEMEVAPDRTMEVREEIKVRFTQPRRGIKRVIPLRQGANRIRLDRIKAGRPNASEGVKISRRDDEVEVRLGRVEALLPPGSERTYFISYRVRDAILERGDQQEGTGWAELYWNAVGPEWDTGMDEVRVRVRPQSGIWTIPASVVLRGAQGASSRQIRSEKQGLKSGQGLNLYLTNEGGAIATTIPLQPYEALTVAMALDPKGFPGPSGWAKFWSSLEPVAPIIFPLLAGLIMPVVWWIWGRDQRLKPGDPIFSPPMDLSPSQCGVLSDGRLDSQDMAAALCSLAQKGFLKLKGAGSTLDEVTVRDDAPANAFLPPEEALIFSAVRRHGPVLNADELKEALGARHREVRLEVMQSLRQAGLIHRPDEVVRALWIAAGILAAVVVGLAGLNWELAPQPLVFGCAALTGVIIVLFGWHMPRLTKKGALVRSQVMRFQQGIASPAAAQGDLMVRQDRFEKLTPYAVSFRQDRTWLSRFSDLPTPAWIVFDDTSRMASHLFSGIMHDMGRAASTPPIRAENPNNLWDDHTFGGGDGGGFGGGFGGGGGFSSGGGFGGGGGSSW